MSKKRIVAAIVILLFAIVSNYLVLHYRSPLDDTKMSMILQFSADTAVNVKLYYSDTSEFTEEHSQTVVYNSVNKQKRLTFDLGQEYSHYRLDFGDLDGVKVSVQDIWFYYSDIKIPYGTYLLEQEKLSGVKELQATDGTLTFTTEGMDSFCAVDIPRKDIQNQAEKIHNRQCLIKDIAICVVLDIFLLIAFIKIKKIAVLPMELFENRKLIFNLAKNDIKTRFAGSYLGIIWAFVNPVITIVVYWFVFQVGLRSNPIDNFPFILWFASGLIPWFFFSEALGGGTGTLIEYSYLVKKVVFKISILPIVKVFSALFIHVFFVLVLMVLYLCYGYGIDWYSLQVVYYSFCMFVLALAISYATSAVVVFFRDLSQVIGVVLQVGMWATPIMWSYTMLPVGLQWILKINPMFYIVEGYLNAMIYKTCFWNDVYGTAYFWLLTIALLGIGMTIFNRLKIHFADVL